MDNPLPVSGRSLAHVFRVDYAHNQVEFIRERHQAIQEIEQLARECEEKGEPLPLPEPEAPLPPAPDNLPITREAYAGMQEAVQEPPCEELQAELRWFDEIKKVAPEMPLRLLDWALEIERSRRSSPDPDQLSRDMFLRFDPDHIHSYAPFFFSRLQPENQKSIEDLIPHFQTQVALFQPPHSIVAVWLNNSRAVWTVLSHAEMKDHVFRGRIMYRRNKELCGCVVDDDPNSDQSKARFALLTRSLAFRGFVMEMMCSYKTILQRQKQREKNARARVFVHIAEADLFKSMSLMQMVKCAQMPHHRTPEGQNIRQNLPEIYRVLRENRFFSDGRFVVLMSGPECNLYVVLDSQNIKQDKVHVRGFIRRQPLNPRESIYLEPQDFVA